MPWPNFLAGQRLTAAMLLDMQWSEIEQEEDQIKNNSASLSNSDLIVPLAGGARYRYVLMAGYDTTSTADIKFAWSAPSGGEVVRWAWGVGKDATGAANTLSQFNSRRPITDTEVAVGGGGASVRSYFEVGLFLGGVGGNAILRFAQEVAEATDTRLLGSSRVEYIRIA